MFRSLPPAVQHELEHLAQSYGQPLVRVVELTNNYRFDPLNKTDRYGEVCMVVLRPNGHLLTMTKVFYPRGVSRLPTGGIHQGEDILAALLRETYEETGLEVEVRRFLAAVAYRLSGDSVETLPVFYTFAFLLYEVGGTLGTLDESERVEAFFEVEPGSLRSVAERLEQVETTYSEEIDGQWRDWGCFRAVIHRVVGEAFAGRGKA
jgi:8-oxo-dGTP pyrophosphatase MutT (NUDIX family)